MISSVPFALLDTDAFSILYVDRRATDERAGRWREFLAGHRVLISFQTGAELLAGMKTRGWGQERQRQLRAILVRTPTIRSSDDVVEAYAELQAWCKAAGHPLQQKQHAADRWVAACAIAKEMPLLAGDRIYQGAPGLTLLDK